MIIMKAVVNPLRLLINSIKNLVLKPRALKGNNSKLRMCQLA